MTTGFLLGKFMPPHIGHGFLCDFAAYHCDKLLILVCSQPDDPIPGRLRFEWMKRMNPGAIVSHCDRVLPQEPADDPDFWNIWKAVIRDHFHQCIDFVYASDAYGARLAEELEADFVPVDPTRRTCPVSATMIREKPLALWPYIPDVVRPHYAKRVVLFGPESTGKTTLAGMLAKAFDTVTFPEYGRTYVEAFGKDVEEDDLRQILHGHLASRSAALKRCNRILFEDSDPLLSQVWSRMLIGKRSPWLENAPPGDLYLLLDIDCPWVDDGTRYFPSDAERRVFHDRCVEELELRRVDYVRVSGNWTDRFSLSAEAIERRWPETG